MPTWLSIVLVIAAVVAAGLLKETWRQRGVATVIAGSGFRRLEPNDTAWQRAAAVLVQRMHRSGARIWGLALAGTLDDVPLTIAEHESSRGINQAPGWYTVVMWRSHQTPGGPIVLLEAPNATMAAALDAVTTLGTGTRLSERLGVTEPATPGDAPARAGRFFVYGASPDRNRWLTDIRVQELEGLPVGAACVVDGEQAAWRFEGTITQQALERLRAEFPRVRRILDTTATR